MGNYIYKREYKKIACFTIFSFFFHDHFLLRVVLLSPSINYNYIYTEFFIIILFLDHYISIFHYERKVLHTQHSGFNETHYLYNILLFINFYKFIPSRTLISILDGTIFCFPT